MSPAETASEIPDPALVLVAVAEGDLQPALAGLPGRWCERLALLQNELLPADWRVYADPTVISVWFEKKPGMDHKVIIPSPVFGPGSRLIADALGTLDIPVRVLRYADELLFELVLKNLYILTSNIAGLRVGGTVGELWAEHQELARRIGGELIELQEMLTGRRFDRDALFSALVHAFEGDPDHKCMGRSAPARLDRALSQADELGLELPTLRELREARS
jgi:hypothetical protein